ncbi:MAG: RidA family protein [Methyloligellaceae bacterium]
MADIKRIETGTRMSQAVVHGELVWLTGQTGAEGESVTAQTQATLANIERLLAEAGSDKTRILQTTIWLANMDDFAEMNAVWDAWVPEGHASTRACGEARLATDGFKVEIICVAAAG